METNSEDKSPSTPDQGASTADASMDPAATGPQDAAREAQDPEPDSPDDASFPDPSSLIAMAGMHMETARLLRVLVSVFDAHAWRSMGLVADYSGEVRKDMPSAQLAIDCMSFLLGKCEPTTEEGEKRDLQRRLTDLRMNYVAKLRDGDS